MKTSVLVPVLAAFFLQTAAAQTNSATAATQGNPKAGEALYLKYGCYQCHGYSGQNGPGARLVPVRMNATQFTSYVRNPARMPPYSVKVVPDAQLADIYAYIRTLKLSPAAKDIPLLNQLNK